MILNLILFIFSNSHWAFGAAGWTCTKSQWGQTCFIEKVETPQFNYSQPVAILIPKGTKDYSKFAIHLHGHILGIERDKTPQAILSDFNFLRLIKNSNNPKSILVIPFSTGKNIDYIQQLAPQFKNFFYWVLATLEVHQPNSVAWKMTGHSGAYKPIAAILKSDENQALLKTLKKVILFDATYGGVNFDSTPYAKLLSVNPAAEIFSVYRPESVTQAGTETGSLKLKSDLSLPDTQIISADTETYPESKDHWDVLKTYFPKLF